MRLSQVGLLALVLINSGCVYVPLGSLPQFTTAQLASGAAIMRVELSIKSGGYRTQASILPYTSADVNHLVVSVYKLAGATEIAVADTVTNIGQPLIRDLDQTAIGAGVALTNLAHNTTYRLRAKAYKAAGQEAADLISDDAASFVDVVVGTDDRPVGVAVPVALIDRLFSGQSTSSFEIIDGRVIDAATESIQ